MEDLKQLLLAGSDLKALRKHYRLSKEKIITAIQELESSGRLTGGFLKRLLERDITNRDAYYEKNREIVLECLLEGLTSHVIRQKLHLEWIGVKYIKECLIEEGSFSDELYGVNVVEFIHQWPLGMSIKEMERQGISYRRRLRKYRDWLLEKRVD